jgi:hypothetical protein
MFYLYDISTFLRYIHLGYIIHSLLLAVASTGLFYLVNRLSDLYSLHRKWLVVLAAIGFIVFYVVCLSLGLFHMRSIAAATVH